MNAEISGLRKSVAREHMRRADLRDETILDLLCRRVFERPAETAFTFVTDSGDEIRLSFAELGARVRRIAAVVEELSVGAGRVLLLYPPGLEAVVAFFAAMYAKAVAVPANPPRHARLTDRITRIAADATPGAVLTTGAILDRTTPTVELGTLLAGVPWVATDRVSVSGDESLPLPGVPPDALAFIQYTSGSISEPMGVMITHQNLMHDQALAESASPSDGRLVMASWLPYFHDMGLNAILRTGGGILRREPFDPSSSSTSRPGPGGPALRSRASSTRITIPTTPHPARAKPCGTSLPSRSQPSTRRTSSDAGAISSVNGVTSRTPWESTGSRGTSATSTGSTS